MLDADMCNAIYQLHRAGCPVRDIRRKFHVSRYTVRAVIQRQGALPAATRKDKIRIDPDLLRRLYRECDGWAQRIHEKLVEEERIAVSYPTLTRLLRELGLSQTRPERCDHVPDVPGAEMQYDTTSYLVRLSDRPTRVNASLLYLRYSKRRYLRFYRRFNRFVMKCFFHEALTYWGYSAPQCIIDRTNLARLRGSGKQAVIVPEMATFAGRYGFQFLCHELKHCNRKAGEERSFWTVETNFLPGRVFESVEDLNQQALEWATVRMHHRPVAKTGLIPAQAFEHERRFLTELSPHLPAPYQAHERDTDQYGYVPFQGNYYWIPGTRRPAVKLLQYANRVKLFQQRVCLAEYPLPADGVKNERFSPAGQPAPRHAPRPRRRDSQQEEQRLRAMGPEVADYLDYALRTPGIQRPRFLRELWALSRQVTAPVFSRALTRALRYRIVELRTVHRIAWFCLSLGEERPLDVEVDESFRQRPAYQEGCLTDEPDLSLYDHRPPDDEPDDPDELDEPDDKPLF
jgi:transposase